MEPSSDFEAEYTDSDILPISPRTDVYSFGMTALEVRLHVSDLLEGIATKFITSLQLYTKHIPFSNWRHHTVVIHDIIQGVRPPRPSAEDCPALTDHMWMMMQSCWEQEPYERPNIDAIVSWLALQENNLAYSV